MAVKLHRQDIEAGTKGYLDNSMLETFKCSPMTNFPTHLGFYFFECRVADVNVLVRA